MRSKRFLSMLLALCLIMSVLSPAVYATTAGEDSVMAGTESEVVTESKVEASQNGLVASTDNQTVTTMRDNEVVLPEVETSASFGNGEWTFAESNVTADLTVSETPDCLAELQEAAQYYAKDEVVAAFVVMEQAPLAEKYTSILSVTAAEEKSLLAVQDKVIDQIETKVLHGQELTVRRQFTYLTNAFSIETEMQNLAEIAKLDGVKTVFIMPVYQAITTDADEVSDPLTASSGEMTGVATVWSELEYTGAGMKIAIIDTGLDLDHPSFAADPELTESSMTVEDIEAVLEDLNAYDYMSSVTAEDLYRSAKIPFAFNYVDANLTADHSSDSMGYHGTHVAGIAAANALDNTTVVGMAPDAQLIILKVFGASGGAYTDDIVAALEDAMTLGCDVVNASLGSSAGFSSTDTEIDLIYERLNSQDIIATISAGNEGTSAEGNTWGTDMNRTQNPDNATISAPSTYANVMSIASANNGIVMTDNFTLADGTTVFYMYSMEYYYGYVYGMESLAGQELEYVMIDGLGEAENFYDEDGNSLVEGKVAVILRGDLSFSEKCLNAEYAGAVAAIIMNHNDEEDVFSFGMTTENEYGEYPQIPVCLISLSDGQKMAAAEEKTMVVSEELAARKANGGQMSSFSSWGVSPDLGLLPDITGIGGNVYSTADGGGYALMSGTSMSSPQVAGVSALVLQYLHERYPNAIEGSLRDMAEALMMSTADPIIADESGVEASPRQQGAGLVDAYEAITAGAYLTVGGDRPKAEMGDSSTGTFTFSFEIHNISDEAKTYTMSGSILTEDIVGYMFSETDVELFMAGYDMALSGSVTFNKDTVTVPAGGKANVKVIVTLSDEDKEYFHTYWENGGYVEGFIYLTNEEGEVELNLPYLGFYGDWTDAPAIDGGMWYDNGFWGLGDGLPESDQFYNIVWTDLGGTDWVLGFNPYSGAMEDENGNIIYDEANNVVSPNGDGVLDGLDELYISLLRNTKSLTLTFTVDGEIVHRETMTNVSKSMYNSYYGQIVPLLYSWYGEGLYDFAGLESGTEVMLTIDARLDYGNGGENIMQIPITVDTGMPELLNVEEIEIDGDYYMAVEVTDDVSLASVVLMNKSGTRIYGQVFDYNVEQTENGTYIAYFDVTDLGTEFVIAVCDYAANEAYYDVTYTAAGDNLPDMDKTQLYAYRVYDSYIYSDHMYGWVSMDKPAEGETANIDVWTDDYLEYAAINAAEYVGGKIFAVDAVYNLVVMEPGLFDRNTICNLGVNVIDMTFDDSTDTMYVLSKQDYYVYLYSMDLLTGELTQLKYYGYYYNAPWAIADDDNGTLYAIKYNSSNIYTLDAENMYAMNPVTVLDEDGIETNVVIKDSNGNAVTPSNYGQSITWADGNLYWAYFKYTYYGSTSELITINTTDWTSYASVYAATGYDEDDNLVEYYPDTELVGLMTLDETDYQIPESTEVGSLILDVEQIILSLGKSDSLSVSWLPWNYNLDKTQLVWTSDDESVATVNNGTVTGVGEGTTTINVSYGDVTASCEIIVVSIEGHFEAYNYYTADGYYGYMIDVDMATMDYTLVSKYSPVDFVAGDYNGHDGYFYGYDMGGQLYRYDYATNEATALGSSLGTYPVDMAYDYSTGMMYALMLDYMTYENTLYAVNMNNGKVMNMGTGAGLMTLAISTDGIMYAMDAYGYLNEIQIIDYSMYGMGCYLQAMPVMDESYGYLYLLESMCWDHNNDVLLWNWCEGASIIWFDLGDRIEYVDDWTGETYAYYENGYSVNIGDPSESGVLELVGMHVVPDEIPELSDVAVESVTAEDMLILTGYEKAPSATVVPFNATCQTLSMTSSDPSIVEVTADGNLLGVSTGSATITATLNDSVGGGTYEVTFNVDVMESADNVYAHLLTDVATYDAQAWIELYPGNPGSYDVLDYFYYTIFTEEYVDGKLYTYGYDAYDWTANWQFFIMDAETYAIETQIEMDDAFPYVYDMTYDYKTATMYVLAGSSEDNTDLYVADMETGKLTLLMEIDPLLLAISAGPDGKLYAIENSSNTMDWETYQTVLGNAQLWAIDPVEGTMEWVGDTGLKSNMISSMAYDYDTDAMYWTAFAQENSYLSNLAIVNLETGLATSLGTIGVSGAQVGGLYIVCDEYPETDDSTLHNVMMATNKMILSAGESKAASLIMMPGNLDADIKWSSSNTKVATVDANGVITGVAQGSATITATVTHNGVTKTASCKVAVLNADAGFLTYNTTDGGWSLISRSDYTVITNLTEGEDEAAVVAIASVGTDVYGYDENNQLFKLDTTTYERTNIGDGLGLEVEEDWQFVVKDMAYDMENERMLVLGDNLLWDNDWEDYSEVYGGCVLYSVDLTTGALEELYIFSDYSYVYAMSAGTNGEVYFYNTFNDEVNKLDLSGETPVVTKIITLQSQSIYGDMYCDYSMHYDPLTDIIYMTFTSNGRFYKMLTIDATLGTLVDNGYIGEVVLSGWYYYGDMVNGLTFVDDTYHKCYSENFVDAAADAWYHEAVDYVVGEGLMNGVSQTAFNPSGTSTRAMMATVLYRLAGSPSVEGLENPFVDVADNAWFHDAIVWAYSEGIVNGVSANVFAPDNQINREQMVTMLWRYAGSPDADTSILDGYTDASTVNSYAVEAFAWAIENKIVNGVTTDTLAPFATSERVMIAVVLYRYANLEG